MARRNRRPPFVSAAPALLALLLFGGGGEATRVLAQDAGGEAADSVVEVQFRVLTEPAVPGVVVSVGSKSLRATDSEGKATSRIPLTPGPHKVKVAKAPPDWEVVKTSEKEFRPPAIEDDFTRDIKITLRKKAEVPPEAAKAVVPQPMPQPSSVGASPMESQAGPPIGAAGAGTANNATGAESGADGGPKDSSPGTVRMALAGLAGAVMVGGVALVALRVRGRRKRGRLMTEFTFGDYQVTHPIGHGGMANVFRAKTRDGKEVALKVLDNKFLNDPDLVAKFEWEAPAMAKIHEVDPEANIPKIYEYGRLKGKYRTPFIAMEVVDGVGFDDVIVRFRPLPLSLVVRVGLDVCRVLEAAHKIGITHRDLSPENLLLTWKGGRRLPNKLEEFEVEKTVVIDFGVAHLHGVEDGTHDGTVTGKPFYMAPEQFDQHAVDARADIYSLGIVLFAACAGRAPYIDPNPDVLRDLHAKAPIPPLPPAVPARLAQLIHRMMAKDANHRPQSAAVVAAGLRQVQEDLRTVSKLTANLFSQTKI
jgi:serine/threonine-protein kinase